MTYEPFKVVEATTRRPLAGMPTPMLISLGGGEAYAVEYPDAKGNPVTVWRARDDSYDPAGTEYRRVRVIRMHRFEVDVEVQNLDPSNDETDPPPAITDTFAVVAATKDEAMADARAKAIEYWQEQEDAPYMATAIRARQED